MYNYMPYEDFNRLAINQWRLVNRLRPNATRKRRKAYSMGLKADYLDSCEVRDGTPIGLSAVHMRAVNLGTGGYYEPIHEVVLTPPIVRFSQSMAFDAQGGKYLTRLIIGYTDALDRELTPYEHTRSYERKGTKMERIEK